MNQAAREHNNKGKKQPTQGENVPLGKRFDDRISENRYVAKLSACMLHATYDARHSAEKNKIKKTPKKQPKQNFSALWHSKQITSRFDKRESTEQATEVEEFFCCCKCIYTFGFCLKIT